MTYCEDCHFYYQFFFEDRGYCQKKKQDTEATDEACEGFAGYKEQMKLEGK